MEEKFVEWETLGTDNLSNVSHAFYYVGIDLLVSGLEPGKILDVCLELGVEVG